MISSPYKNTATLIIAEATFSCVHQAFGQYSTLCIVSATPATLDVTGFSDKQDTEAFLLGSMLFLGSAATQFHSGLTPKGWNPKYCRIVPLHYFCFFGFHIVSSSQTIGW